MLQTTSTERRAAGGDLPRSCGSDKVRPPSWIKTPQALHPPFTV